MVSVVTSTNCTANNNGVPVTELPNTGFSVTSVNLVGTANIGGREQAILIEGVDLQAILDANNRISVVSVIADDNTRVPIGGFWPASVEGGDTVFRFATPVGLTLQNTGHFAVIGQLLTQANASVQIFTGDTSATSQIGNIEFTTSGRDGVVSVNTSVVVNVGEFIEVRAPGSVAEQIEDFSFTLFARRLPL